MKTAFLLLIGAVFASGVWYYFDFYNPEQRLARTQQKLYDEKVKEVDKQLKTGNTTEALRTYATAKRANTEVQAAIVDPSNINGCGSFSTTPNPVTHNIHITIPAGCGGGATSIHHQRPHKPGEEQTSGKGVSMKVSPWAVMVNGSLVPVATPVTFQDSAGSFHHCQKDGEGQICDFYGNVMIDTPYSGADIHLDFIKEFEVIDKTQFEIHGGSVTSDDVRLVKHPRAK